jgi:hypothetical protein
MEDFKTLIPLATFLLGVVVTLILKSHDRRREVIRDNVEALCGLSEDWYNRIQTLGRMVVVAADKKAVEEALLTYLHGSLYLSRFRRSIAILERNKACEAFLDEARAFLSTLAEVNQVHLKGYFIPQKERFFDQMQCMQLTVIEEKRRPASPQFRRLLLRAKGAPYSAAWIVEDTEESSPSREEVAGFEVSSPKALATLYARVQSIHLEAAKLLA